MRIISLDSGDEANLAPDLVFDGMVADLALQDEPETDNRGGLRARAQLATAVLICLMTDARVEASELRAGEINRGWHGDSYDLDTAAGEAPIGSKLWLLRRHKVDDAHVPRLAELYAEEACQPLIDQRAAAAVKATAWADPKNNLLMLEVELTDVAGAVTVSPRFQILWS